MLQRVWLVCILVTVCINAVQTAPTPAPPQVAAQQPGDYNGFQEKVCVCHSASAGGQCGNSEHELHSKPVFVTAT